MVGTKAGGSKAAKTNKEKHGEDFYARIGKKGGSRACTKGFASKSSAFVSACGKKGGSISKRGPAKKKPVENIVEKPVENSIKKYVKKEVKMNEVTLTYYGVVTAKKNSKQIIWNHATRRPMLISNRRAKKQENDMVQSFMLESYSEGWRGGHINSTYQIEIQIWNQDRRRRDLDNQATAILDALVLAHIIPDDSVEYVQKVSVEYKGLDKQEPRAVVKVKETEWRI